MKDFALNGLLDGSKHYTEFRAQRNTTSVLMLLNGDVTNNSESISSGLSCRTNIDGEWGFASSSRLEQATANELVAKAEKNAQFMAGRKSSGLKKAALPTNAFEFHRDYEGKPAMSQKEILDFLKALDAKVEKNYSDLKSRQFMFAFHELEKKLVNSIGSSAYHVLPRTSLYFTFAYEKDGEVVSLMETLGDFGRPADFLDNPDALDEKLEMTYKHVVDKASGVHAKAGTHDVIISPDVVGVLAHEAIGHPAEADLVRAGSVAGNYVDQKVGSELVTMIDYAHTRNGQELPVPVYIDDEGTEGKDAVLIDKGVFKGFMNNRELASHYDHAPTGSARAYDFNDEPLVRMRNTIIEPGESKLDDMIANIKDGYYLIQRANGQADLTSEFMFGVTMGYEIKNGKLGKAIKDTTISGIAFDMLKTVDMVSDEFLCDTTGFCGKKQRMIVSHGGPSLKCRVHLGGR